MLFRSRIPPLGSIAAQARKTPKFKFAAPSFRVALLSSVGAWNDSSEGYGALIEDAVALMLNKSVDAGHLHAIAFDPEENGADYVVTCKNGEMIAIEVGYGKKQSDQVARTMKRCDARYGLVVSKERFRMIEEQKIIFIPREFFII